MMLVVTLVVLVLIRDAGSDGLVVLVLIRDAGSDGLVVASVEMR